MLLLAGALPVLPVLSEETQLPQMDAALEEDNAVDSDEEELPESMLSALCAMALASPVALLSEQGGKQFAPIHPLSLQDILEEVELSVGLEAAMHGVLSEKGVGKVHSVLAVLARRDAVCVQLAARLGISFPASVFESVREGALAEDECNADGVLSVPCTWLAFGVWEPDQLDEDGSSHMQHSREGQLDLVHPDGPRALLPGLTGMLGSPSQWDRAGTGVSTELVARLLNDVVRVAQETCQCVHVHNTCSCSVRLSCSCVFSDAFCTSSGVGRGLMDACIVACSIFAQQQARQTLLQRNARHVVSSAAVPAALTAFEGLVAAVRWTRQHLRSDMLRFRQRRRASKLET
jgi:hypothetical protein